MSSSDFIFGDLLPIEVGFENQAGSPVLGAAGGHAVRRDFDDQFWDGSEWQELRVFLPMDKISDLNSPGEFKIKFDSSVGEKSDLYTVYLKDINGVAFNQLEPLYFLVGGSFAKQLEKLLGLAHENFVLEGLTFDVNKLMTSGRVRTYDSKANAKNNDGTTGIKDTYLTASEFDTEGKLIKFTQTLETI